MTTEIEFEDLPEGDGINIVDVAVHATLKIENESIYEMFLADLHKVFESYAFITPDVEVKACDQEECFDRYCEMRADWKVK